MCVAKVMKTVDALDGVKKARVSKDMKKLTVTADTGIDADMIVTAIKENGYGAERSS